MNISVRHCRYLDNGARREYLMNNQSLLVELPNLPGKSRYQFYDAAGRRVFRNADRVAMRQAADRHKVKWRLAK